MDQRVQLVVMLGALCMVSCKEEKSPDAAQRRGVPSKSSSSSSPDPSSKPERIAKLARDLNLKEGKKSNSRIAEMRREMSLLSKEELLAVIQGLNGATSEDKLAIGAAVEALAALDPQAALSIFAERCQNNSYGISEIFSTLMARDRSLVLDWVNNGEPGTRNPEALGCIAREVAKTAPEEAWKLLSTNTSTEERTKILFAISTQLAMHDVKAAASEVALHLTGAEKDKALFYIVNSKAALSPDVCLQLAGQIQSAQDRSNATREVISGAIKRDPEKAVAMISSLDPRDTAALLTNWSIIEDLSKFDIAALEAAAMKISPTSSNASTFTKIGEQLIRSDPERFLKWASEFQHGPFRDGVFESSFSTLAGIDPQLAVDKLADLSPESRSAALLGVAGGWPSGDFDALAGWADSLQPSAKEAVLAESLKHLLAENPEQFLDSDSRASRSLSSLGEDAQRSLFSSAGTTLFSRNQEGAIEWFTSLEPSKQSLAVDGLTNMYADSDIVAASEWVMKIPSKEAKKRAMTIIADKLKTTDPEAASRWSQQALSE
jgi:hypothetical protein